MKKSRILISVLLALALVLGFGSAASAQTELKVGLGEKIGELERDYVEFWTGALTDRDGDKLVVLDAQGERKLERSFDYVQTLFGNESLLLGIDESLAPNSRSLFKADGTVLFEDAAIVMETDPNGRYLEVGFATEQVETEEECFLYYTTLGENEEYVETMYAGYSMVYDTREERFVENLRTDNPGDAFAFVGENVLLAKWDLDESNELYRPDGSLVCRTDEYPVSGAYFVLYTDDDRCSVRDENMEELLVLDFYPYEIYAGGTLFAQETNGGEYLLVNAAGEAVSELLFEYSPEEYGNFIYGEDGDGRYAVLSLTGEPILRFEDGVSEISKCDHGFLSICYADGRYELLYPDGLAAELQEECDARLTSVLYDTNEIFLLDPAAYQRMDGDVETMAADLLFLVVNEDGLCGLYSLVDGQELLPQAYREIGYANGCVYAQRDTDRIYEIYPVIVNG